MENSDIEIIHEEGVPFVFLDLIGEGKKNMKCFSMVKLLLQTAWNHIVC
ncbi:hypothetical protein AMCSP13_000201 [Streptococcus pneumoniae 2070335]|nr:hypothetical protein AMCSP13_000201 [Streptococcus pneumoniae 2070335]